ncbi:MAG TPA: YicC family protein [Verrucomicrobiales bacterium]|nr:YicC family protein [Verrucomicrobiales bacterium]
MTGYGRGAASLVGMKVTVEIGSINRKQSEIVLSMPREIEPLENQVRALLNQSISRGRLNVRIAIDASKSSTAALVRLNTNVARQYLTEIRRLQKDLRVADATFSIDALLRAPGVVELVNPLEDAAKLWPPIEKALKSALQSLLKMRKAEGVALRKDLVQRIQNIASCTDAIASAAPEVAKRYREALLSRLAAAELDVAIDDERLLKEIALFADRSDITEELTRLRSHFEQFHHCIKTAEPVGRTLDFLVQEMNREVNTIGSKANDANIAAQVIQIKAELERFREQAQNVE